MYLMSRSRDIVHAFLSKKGGTVVIVIPKPLREELGITPGDTFLVKTEGSSKLVYRKVNSN